MLIQLIQYDTTKIMRILCESRPTNDKKAVFSMGIGFGF